MKDPQKPYSPTEEQLKSGANKKEILKLIAIKNNNLWQEDRDKLRNLQSYTNKLLEEIKKQNRLMSNIDIKY